MNIKTASVALLFGALNIFALGAHAAAPGAKPDIRQVVSVVEDPSDSALCSVVNTHLTYLDSSGQQHVFDYRKFASNCLEGG